MQRRKYSFAFVCALALLLGSCSENGESEPEQLASLPPETEPAAEATGPDFRYETYTELEALFLERGYTPESWKAGERGVPRLYLANIPERYRKTVSKEVPVATKKRIFFRVMAPLFLRSNELILEQRTTVEKLKGKLQAGGNLDDMDRTALDALAADYLQAPVVPGEEADAVDELFVRVDIVPLSLALAQAAEESGWGTSRFADVGNALFGQWTYGGEGITPEQQRKSKGDYKIAAFDSPLDSARAYMKNLNTHRAYEEFRTLRASIRAKEEKLTGTALVPGLSKYSERGTDYIHSLKTIMRVNKLAAADDAYLEDGPGVTLVPVGEGAD